MGQVNYKQINIKDFQYFDLLFDLIYWFGRLINIR